MGHAMSVTNVAVDPSVGSISSLIFTTQPLSAYILCAVGLVLAMLGGVFWALFGHVLGQLKIPLKPALFLLAICAFGILACGSTIIIVQSWHAGKLVTPADSSPPPPKPEATTKDPSPEVVVRNSPPEPGRPAKPDKPTGTNPNELTKPEPAVVEPRIAGSAVTATTPNLVSISYIIRGSSDLPRYPGGLQSSSDVSRGLDHGMRISLTNAAGKTPDGTTVSLTGNFIVESVDSNPGPIGTYETATLRKATP